MLYLLRPGQVVNMSRYVSMHCVYRLRMPANSHTARKQLLAITTRTSHRVHVHESQVVHFSVLRWMTSEIVFATTRSACTDGCSSSNLRNTWSARCGMELHSAGRTRTRGSCPGLFQSRPCRHQDRLNSRSVRRRMHVRLRSR